MTARAKSMSSLRYLHADACALPSFMNDYTCRAVIDKGTLDAIASGGESDSAIRYLNEMWRILNPNGRFLIVSTMPPHLFDLLAVSIVSSHDYSVKSLKTPEGGDVFYYSLERRTRPISADLESLLRETRNAQKQMEELLQKVFFYFFQLFNLFSLDSAWKRSS